MYAVILLAAAIQDIRGRTVVNERIEVSGSRCRRGSSVPLRIVLGLHFPFPFALNKVHLLLLPLTLVLNHTVAQVLVLRHSVILWAGGRKHMHMLDSSMKL